MQNDQVKKEFPALTGNPVFYRTYSHKVGDRRETWEEVCSRAIAGLAELGNLTQEEIDLIHRMAVDYKAMPSGRWLWVGGRDWVKNPDNFSGAYNCTSTNIVDVKSFALMMSLAMMGSGTGAVLSEACISQLPPVSNKIAVKIVRQIGEVAPGDRKEKTSFERIEGDRFLLTVGDSREGWAGSYHYLLLAAMSEAFAGLVNLEVDLGNVRPAGEKLKGFGGVSNPVKLPGLYERCAAILNKAVGRKLTSVECCLLIDEAAVVVVAGNVRRCLPKGALVHTSKGLMPIEQVQEGTEVETPQGFRKVLKNFDQGRQQVYRVNTNANSLFATEDHKVAILADTKGSFIWKKVRELDAGDRLLHTAQTLPGANIQLPRTWSDFLQTRNFKFPSLNSNVAWLIGHTQGGGYASIRQGKAGNRFGFVRWTREKNNPVQQTIRSKITNAVAEFGLEVKETIETRANNKKIGRLNAYSNPFAEFILEYVKQPKTLIQVPDWILMSSPTHRSAYLAGLVDSDNHNSFHLASSMYFTFVKQVAALYSSLGIPTKLSQSFSKKGNDSEPQYYLSLVGSVAKYNDLIAPYSAKGIKSTDLNNDRLTIPGHLINQDYPNGNASYLDKFPALDHEVFANIFVPLNYIPITVQDVQPWKECETYDLEIEDQHCFFVEGLLVHNSAGIRQADYDDRAFAVAKDNLWQQDAEGNWRIDPERDALRMANHTRVFHHKPTLEEVTESVTKQYYSGEGAIQWAGEAIARASADLLPEGQTKRQFIQAYQDGWGGAFLKKLRGDRISLEEIEDRLQRFGLNPCVTGDTWVHTSNGPRRVVDLIGKQHTTYVNGELFSTTQDGFFSSGVKPVLKLTTKEGYSLRLTANHKLLKACETSSEWIETDKLKEGDRVMLHNHQDLKAWDGNGTQEEGKMFGEFLGSTCVSAWNLIAIDYKKLEKLATVIKKLGIVQNGESFADQIEKTSYEFYLGFLAGLFGTSAKLEKSQNQESYILLDKGEPSLFQRTQRMLLRLGITSAISEHDLRIQGNEFLRLAEITNFLGSEKITTKQMIALMQKYKPLIRVGFFAATVDAIAPDGVEEVFDCTVPGVAKFDANGFVAHNCGEIIGKDFHCNLAEIHLNQIDPLDIKEQSDAFRSGSIIAATLLHHKFAVDRYQKSRELDPIIGVSFTGLFDFFVRAFGTDWLRWWECDRRQDFWIQGEIPSTLNDLHSRFYGYSAKEYFLTDGGYLAGRLFSDLERQYLSSWKWIVRDTVWEYCDRHNLKRPNRYTTTQPGGTKSLLTGASAGWHPPKGARYIRRITFAKNDPVALACLDAGYSVIPGQSDKDENGTLLNNPFDPRCTEWLVEIPVATPWADLEGCDRVDISKFSAVAQFDFYMQVQRYYTTHNTSATIELREGEVEELAHKIHYAIDKDLGYISSALLARFDDHQAFPRLPFEPISKEKYEQMVADVQVRRKADFLDALEDRDRLATISPAEEGPAACDSDKCLL